MVPPARLLPIPAWVKAAMCIAVVVALHLALTDMQPLVPFERPPLRPLLGVEGVIIGIGALIVRGIARRRHAIVDMAATNAPPGGMILVSTDPIPWLPVRTCRDRRRRRIRRSSWLVRRDRLTRRLVIRKWGRTDLAR
jgi:hypothetical protein